MNQCAAIEEVQGIMLGFAEDTGLSSSHRPRRRYLWTDAFAVCNFLSLYVQTDKNRFLDLAHTLIDQVHMVLGRHRDDDPRSGWISGLSEKDGRDHPTAGGLRIGKKLNERGPGDAHDQRLEWERDGQYFHYLTKWMHALCRASAVTGERRYCRWAFELAQAAHAGFSITGADGIKRICWKMSIDLSRPQVASSGLHDPLDGYVTYNEIVQCASRLSDDAAQLCLDREIADTFKTIAGQPWETDDPLGIGGLLCDAHRMIQLTVLTEKSFDITERLVSSVIHSLGAYTRKTDLRLPAEHRLAFRELGLAIGLHAVPLMQRLTSDYPPLFSGSLRANIADLQGYARMATAIENFWRDPRSRRASTWLEHLDINRVMLATSLIPDEFLAVGPAHHVFQ